MVADLRQAAAKHSDYPPVVFFYQGTASRGEAFFKDYWPEARAVADKPMTFYPAFGVERGSLSQLMNLGVLKAAARAASKGHMQSATEGDAAVMPGMFLVQGDEILWWHAFDHAGDRPDLDEIPAITRKFAGEQV